MPTFISHSQKDEAIYSTLCMALDATDVARWDSSKMAPGDSLANQLRQAISMCEVCIFVATRHSIESPWCSAELGAFWGAGKRVLIFLVDSDLTEAILPPQFKGNLWVDNINMLISAAKQTIIEYRAITASEHEKYDFFRHSGDYGRYAEWAKLLDDTEMGFDILGIALKSWRDMNNATERFLNKAKEGCRIRVLMMSPDNDLLNGLLIANNKSKKTIDTVKFDIKESYGYYKHLSEENKNISVRQIERGIPHFFLTKTDQTAIIIQYTSALDWGDGPTWRCKVNTDLYDVAKKEFEHLWEFGTTKELSETG